MKHCRTISRKPELAQTGGGEIISTLEVKITFLVQLTQQIITGIFQTTGGISFR